MMFEKFYLVGYYVQCSIIYEVYSQHYYLHCERMYHMATLLNHCIVLEVTLKTIKQNMKRCIGPYGKLSLQIIIYH